MKILYINLFVIYLYEPIFDNWSFDKIDPKIWRYRRKKSEKSEKSPIDAFRFVVNKHVLKCRKFYVMQGNTRKGINISATHMPGGRKEKKLKYYRNIFFGHLTWINRMEGNSASNEAQSFRIQIGGLCVTSHLSPCHRSPVIHAYSCFMMWH